MSPQEKSFDALIFVWNGRMDGQCDKAAAPCLPASLSRRGVLAGCQPGSLKARASSAAIAVSAKPSVTQRQLIRVARHRRIRNDRQGLSLDFQKLTVEGRLSNTSLHYTALPSRSPWSKDLRLSTLIYSSQWIRLPAQHDSIACHIGICRVPCLERCSCT